MDECIRRTHFKTPFGCDRLQSPWDLVVGKKGSRRTSVRLRALFTSSLAHRLIARSRFKISFEMGSKQSNSCALKELAVVWFLTAIFISVMGCQNNIQTKGLLEDLDYYVNTVYEAHSDPFRRISQEDFERKVEALRQYVLANKDDEISTVEWFYRLQELVASMEDGHTNIWFPGGSWSSLEPIFPFRLKVIAGAVYVIEKWGKDSVPAFSQILEVNEIPIDALFERSSTLYSTSLDHAKAMWFEIKFSHRLSTYLGLQAPWNVKYRHDGQVQTAIVQGMSSGDYISKWRKLSRSQYRKYSFSVDGVEIPVLEIPNYSHGGKAQYHRFIDRFFSKHKDAEYLVIDLRLNPGGSGYWGYYLLDYLAHGPYLITKRFDFKVSDHLRNSEYAEKAVGGLDGVASGEYLTVQSDLKWTPHTDENKFRGKVFLLISERTFSAGAGTAAIFKHHKMGTIIGQETSGRVKLCSDPVTIELPHSKLKASVPVAIYTLPGNNPDRGVIPDIEVEHSIEDFRDGRDREMEKVKELIRKGL